MIFSVPPVEREYWPSLGSQVVAWMEANLVFGPGDLRGQPLKLDTERKALIYRFYEVYPRTHPQAGRRRFRRCAISVRKGVGKTELAALVAAAELSPSAPVRCVGWNGDLPIGAPVQDPYVCLVAYTEEQSEELAYGALRVILEESRVAHEFDIGLERILRVTGDGKAVALASAPDARDGARTTFSVADETHRWTLPRLRQAHRVMLANLPKRRMADPWALETTTSYSPGEGSVAEGTMAYARAVADGRAEDARLFFFHRSASEAPDLTTREGIRAAVLEASGPQAEWSDIDGIVEQFDDPAADRAYLCRVWLNLITQSSGQAFDAAEWAARAVGGEPPDAGALITLGWHGARYADAAALVATDVETGYQWLVRAWEAPVETRAQTAGRDAWEVPADEVDQAVADAFERWDVFRFYVAPQGWESTVAAWGGLYDPEEKRGRRVVPWHTNQWERMARACSAFRSAIAAGELSHDGSAVLARHVGACHKRALQSQHDDSGPRWVVSKAAPDSPRPINAAVAAILSWQARCDALAAGADSSHSVYDERAARGEEILRWV